MVRLLLFVILIPLASLCEAKIMTQKIEYRDDQTVMEGFLAFDSEKAGKRPAVLVIPEWWGLNDYVKMRTTQLAEMGYVAFAADMYGGGKVTKDPKQAGEWAGEVRKNTALARSRSQAALDTLARQELVDTSRMAAIGFCFGGAVALELAYSGAPLKGVVAFHSNLPPLKPEDAARLKAAILVQLGSLDTFVSPDERKAFQTSMDSAKADWEMVVYGGAVHAFTNPGATALGLPGIAYNKKAATRSWREMQAFFSEIFK